MDESLAFSQFQTAVQMPERPVSIEDFPESDSDDQAPPSMLFEQRPLLDQNPPPTHTVEPRIPAFPLRRRATRYQPETKIIESWTDVQHLDEFLTRIYDYYQGKGLICIVIEQITDLLTVAFVVGLSIFLSECIDYSKISSTKKLQDVIVNQCVWKYYELMQHELVSFPDIFSMHILVAISSWAYTIDNSFPLGSAEFHSSCTRD
jgi:hypothetical protein